MHPRWLAAVQARGVQEAQEFPLNEVDPCRVIIQGNSDFQVLHWTLARLIMIIKKMFSMSQNLLP